MSCLVEHKSTYDPKNTSIAGLENIQEEKNSQSYYKFHLYLKMIIAMMIKVKSPIYNQMYNIMITMKWNNQG